MIGKKKVTILYDEVAFQLLTIFKTFKKLLVFLLNLVFKFNGDFFDVFCEYMIAIFIRIVWSLRRN